MDLNLRELVPGGIFVGTSLILRQGDRFLYGIRPAREEGGRPILELTGIGGGLEGRDRSLSDGAIREAQEEIGCPVRLLVCSDTLLVRSQTELERVALDGTERPAAVVFRNYRTPPHQPWHEDSAGKACIVVFAAEIDGRPSPVGELPQLIWLKPAHILQTARDDIPLGEMLNTGVELITGTAGSPRRIVGRG